MLLLKQGSSCIFTEFCYPFLDLQSWTSILTGLLLAKNIALDLLLPEVLTFCFEQWVIFTFAEESC